MTQEQFIYWLQGFAELNPATPPTLEQWESICEHLNTVFVKVTKPLTSPTPNILPAPQPVEINQFDKWEMPKDWQPPANYCKG